MKRILLLTCLLLSCVTSTAAQRPTKVGSAGMVTISLLPGDNILSYGRMPDKKDNPRASSPLCAFNHGFRKGDVLIVSLNNKHIETLKFDGEHWYNQYGELADRHILDMSNEVSYRLLREVNEKTEICVGFLFTSDVGDYVISRRSAMSTPTLGSSAPLEIVVNDATWKYKKTQQGIVVLDANHPTSERIIVPNEIEGLPVVEISGYVFSGYKNKGAKIYSITIPASVRYIGRFHINPFRNISSLKEINVDADNPNFISLDGVLYTRDRRELIAAPQCVTPRGIVDEIKIIHEGAFAGCRNIGLLMLPVGIEKIGAAAFMGCHNLHAVLIPETVKSTEKAAFSYCPNLSIIDYMPLRAPKADAFERLSPTCIIRVRRESSGWNVSIPGSWNGMRIEYID